MRKNIKNSASLIIIILSLMFSYVTYAEDNSVVGDNVIVKKCQNFPPPDFCMGGINDIIIVDKDDNGCPIYKCKTDDRKENRDSFMQRNKEDNKIKKDEFQNRVKELKGEVKTNKEENRNQLETMIQQVKDKRQEFKTQIDAKREEVKGKIADMKTNLKEELKKVKDENKKITTENIIDKLNELNTKMTDNLSERITKIENVLVSIESRISKAEARGLDVSKAKEEVVKAKEAIVIAREAVSTQASKVYGVNITSEATLKAEMKKLRDTFRNDIKTAQDKVKVAHVAVKTTATTLAKIPKIDDDKVDTTSPTTVEDNNSTIINN